MLFTCIDFFKSEKLNEFVRFREKLHFGPEIEVVGLVYLSQDEDN